MKILGNRPLWAAILCICAPIVSEASDAIDEYVAHEMRSKQIPGVAFAVVEHGQITVVRAYGTANLETGTPVSKDSVFEIASVTKPFTATAVMMLAEEGKLKLDDPIYKYIEGTPPAWKDITIRELLSHTSGVHSVSWVEWDGSPLLRITTKQLFDEIAKSPLDYAPGEKAA